MKKIVLGFLIVTFTVLTLPSIVLGGNVLKDCDQTTTDSGLKQYVCPDNLVLTDAEQTSLNNANDRLQRNFDKLHDRLQTISDRRAVIKDRVTDRRASAAARLAEHRKERIRAFFRRMVARLNAAITRLSTLVERIESRIVKINDLKPDVDTTNIQAQVDEAKDLLVQAKADLDAAEASLEEVLASDDPKDAFEIVRELIHDIRDTLKQVHRLLVDTIGDIKGLRIGNTDKPVRDVSPTEVPSTDSGNLN